MTTALTRTQRAQTTTRSTQSSGGGSVLRGTLGWYGDAHPGLSRPISLGPSAPERARACSSLTTPRPLTHSARRGAISSGSPTFSQRCILAAAKRIDFSMPCW